MSEDLRIEVLTEERWDEMIRLEGEFLDSKHCCCCLPLGTNVDKHILKKFKEHPEFVNVVGVAIVRNEVVGFIMVPMEGMPCVRKIQPGEAYIETIMVEPGSRGMGIGAALLDWAEELAKSHKCDRLTLDVVRNNPAFRLYERKGFHVKPKSLLETILSIPIFLFFMSPVICTGDSPMYCSNGQCDYMVKELKQIEE